MSDRPLPALSEDWEPTPATLHAYAQAVGAIARAHAIPHPMWWHISLKVRPAGLVTETMAVPGGGTFDIRMDLRTHEIVIETSTGTATAIPMTDGLTGTEMGDALIKAVAELGLDGEYVREKFENEDARIYDTEAAATFFMALVNIEHILEEHRSTLEGEVGPLQVWPHGFDLAFEWFGTRYENYDGMDHRAQLNLGWYPAGAPYFYSNPWPFEGDKLTTVALPEHCSWHTEGWEGSKLEYDKVTSQADGRAKILEYAQAVHDAAAPTLLV